jgi:UDP-N-acetylmuramyl-tripeptide synthetase/UDP-N-acetylmuramoyl-tripeptide--D-alanyl-D-alanine ligase
MLYNITINEIISLLKKNNLYVSERSMPAQAVYTGIYTDSRKVSPGGIFVCVPGFNIDGHLFAGEAIEKQAELLITEHDTIPSIASIIVKNSRQAAALLCFAFYRINTNKLKLAGITGTNGKSTTAYLGYQLAKLSGINAGFIGTTGCYITDKFYPTSLTTPDSTEIAQLLAKAQEHKVELVFMEVSSHAMALDRLAGLQFSAALFLNLSQDHLDFHQELESYFLAKFKLFEQIKNDGYAIVNIDDSYGERIKNEIQANCVTISHKNSDISYIINKLDIDTSYFTLLYENQEYQVASPLAGAYNIQNLIFALGTLFKLFPQFKVSRLISKVNELQAVPGRLEKVPNLENRKILIDYAHTPEAILKVTQTMAQLKTGRLITVMGAGGNRDKTKRPQMLKAAQKYSDLVIITTDNPRYEEPVEIIKDIMHNADTEKALWIKEDRTQAIYDALKISHANDIVLITGKGHETYQDILGKKYHFDEREIIRNYFFTPADEDISFDRLMLEFVCTGKITTNKNCLIKHITTDTRTIKPDSLFIPLKGANYDGHDYLPEALKYPSNLALSEKYFDDERIIKIDDAQISYGKIAQAYRRLLDTTLVAITGSNGKTSVKEILYNLIKRSGNTSKTYSNENNYIGVPKTLLNIKPSNIFAIIELGTNQPGEIKWLTQITQPNIAVITNIGASHLEFLIDEAGVFREKINIFSTSSQIKIFPGDDERFKHIRGASFGYSLHSKYRIHQVACAKTGYRFCLNENCYHTSLRAEFQVTNAAIAVIIARHLGISEEEIALGLAEAPDLPLRLEEFDINGLHIIADCYNANPQSMKAALKYWQQFSPTLPHIAILGSMLELGDYSITAHQKTGKLVNAFDTRLFISVGEAARDYQADCHYENIDALLASLKIDKLPQDSVILVKGSHGIHLEKLIDSLKQAINHSSEGGK